MTTSDASGPEARNTDLGIVALFDALATKGILATRPASDVLTSWSKILEIVTVGATVAANDPCCSSAHPVSFSDTIIFPMIPKRREDFPDLLALMSRVLQETFVTSLQLGVFFRGSIAAGAFHQTDSKIFGPAIDEAAAWYEQSDWIGMSATPTLSRLLEIYEQQGVNVSAHFMPYSIPYKELKLPSDQKGWALNWPGLARERFLEGEITLLHAFSKYAGPVTPEVAQKYEHTLKFFRTAGSPLSSLTSE